MMPKMSKKTQDTAEEVLGFQSRSSKPLISSESCSKIDERRELRKKTDSTRFQRIRERHRYAHSAKDKEVKEQLKKDKNDWTEKIAEEAQKATERGNLKTVYDATRKLSNKKGRTMDMVKNKDGVLLTDQDENQKRWKEHFLEALSRPALEDALEFDGDDGIPDLEIAVEAPTRV